MDTLKTPIQLELTPAFPPETFDTTLRTLHAQYLRREITLVKFADTLHLAPAQLTAALEAAGLPLRNVRPRVCNL